MFLIYVYHNINEVTNYNRALDFVLRSLSTFPLIIKYPIAEIKLWGYIKPDCHCKFYLNLYKFKQKLSKLHSGQVVGSVHYKSVFILLNYCKTSIRLSGQRRLFSEILELWWCISKFSDWIQHYRKANSTLFTTHTHFCLGESAPIFCLHASGASGRTYVYVFI